MLERKKLIPSFQKGIKRFLNAHMEVNGSVISQYSNAVNTSFQFQPIQSKSVVPHDLENVFK